MSTAEHHRESPFAHKGWNRLVIVLCAAYLIVIVFLVIYERTTINHFDQFDKTPPDYQFWVWSPPGMPSASEHHLKPHFEFIAALITLPPLALAAGIYSVLWVYQGFRHRHKPDNK